MDHALKTIKQQLRNNLDDLKKEHNLSWKEELKILQMLSSDLGDELNHSAAIILRPRE